MYMCIQTETCEELVQEIMEAEKFQAGVSREMMV
jgi:hypothetical protein